MIKEKPYSLFILEPKILDRLVSTFERKENIAANIDYKGCFMDWQLFYDLVMNLKNNYSISDILDSQATDDDELERTHRSFIDFLKVSFCDIETFHKMLYDSIDNLVTKELHTIK